MKAARLSAGWIALASAATLLAGCGGTQARRTSTTAVTGVPTVTVQTRTVAGLPSPGEQIRTLAAAVRHMQAIYPRLPRSASPGPADIFDYDIGALWSKGLDGAGITVALLEGWNDPQIGKVMQEFDSTYDLPAARISTFYPEGRLPRTCPLGMVKLGAEGVLSGLGGEIAIDVASVHLIAPYAHILLVPAPTEETPGADATEYGTPPAMMLATEEISRRHLANVISVSDAGGETTYPHGVPEITAQDPGELAAAAAGVPLLDGTGDCGVVQQLATSTQFCGVTTRFPSVAAWSDSPWVTAVGGSTPDLNRKTAKREGPDHLWHPAQESGASANAGLSRIYARPSYQNGVASITHSRMRSVPDITMDASDGTSEAIPLFAGVLALATQDNGGTDLGPVNPALYALGPEGTRAGIVDVIGGNDTFSQRTRTRRVFVRGYTATRGYDIASGWGTVDAATFVPNLVAETAKLHAEATARGQARAQLTSLEDRSLTATLSGRALSITATGLLPAFPTTLLLEGRIIGRLRAGDGGELRARLTVPARDLGSGAPSTVTLSSLLITETARVRRG